MDFPLPRPFMFNLSTNLDVLRYFSLYDLNPPGHSGPHLLSAGVNQHSAFEVNEEKLTLHQLRIWPSVTVTYYFKNPQVFLRNCRAFRKTNFLT